MKNSLGGGTITVVAICSDHQVSTYSLPPLPESLTRIRAQNEPDLLDKDPAPDRRTSRTEPVKDVEQTAGETETSSPVKESCEAELTCATPSFTGGDAPPTCDPQAQDQAGGPAGGEAPKGGGESGAGSGQHREEEAGVGPNVREVR